MPNHEPAALMDTVGFFGNLFEHVMVVALGGSAILVFLYLWRKGRLDMDQEPAVIMMEADEGGGTHDKL